jgi:hypothetical protein
MPDNPTNQGAAETQTPPAAQPSGEPTSEGEPVSTTPPTPQAQPTAAAPDDPLKAAQAKVSRLEQEHAKTANLLQQLGVDPNSDTAERFASGVLTKEDLLREIGVQVPAPAQPQITPQQKMDMAIERMKKDGVTEADVIGVFEAVRDAQQNVQGAVAQRDFRDNLTECLTAVTNTIKADEVHSKLPDTLREIEEQIFISSTDNRLMREAQYSRNPDSYKTPQNYSRFAQQQAQRLNNLRNYYIEQGRQMERQQAAPPPQGTPPPAPISPSVGSGPTVPPAQTVNRDNWKEQTDQWAKQNLPRNF